MKRGKKKAWFYSMPFLIIVGLMIVVPLLYTVEISFTNMSIYTPSAPPVERDGGVLSRQRRYLLLGSRP